MVSMIASSVVDRGFEPRSGYKLQTINLIFAASLLSTHHSRVRAKTGWLGVRMICPSGMSCLPAG